MQNLVVIITYLFLNNKIVLKERKKENVSYGFGMFPWKLFWVT